MRTISQTRDWKRARIRPPLQWCHNERDGVSNHQPHDCLLNRLFRRRSKKTTKLRVTGLCEGNSPVTDEFPAQRASNAFFTRMILNIYFQPGVSVLKRDNNISPGGLYQGYKDVDNQQAFEIKWRQNRIYCDKHSWQHQSKSTYYNNNRRLSYLSQWRTSEDCGNFIWCDMYFHWPL